MEIVKVNGYKIKLNKNIKREREWIEIFTTNKDSLYGNIFSTIVCKFYKNPVCCDIGSHIGGTSLLWINHGASEVYSFEPVKKFYNRIVEINCDKIQVYNFALSNENTEKEINISTHEVGSTLKNDIVGNPKYKKLFNNTKETVVLKRLDDLDIDINFDFMKINAEGSEKDIIEGGINYFKNNTPKILFIELLFEPEMRHNFLNDIYQYRYSINYTNNKIVLQNISIKSNKNHYLFSIIKLI